MKTQQVTSVLWSAGFLVLAVLFLHQRVGEATGLPTYQLFWLLAILSVLIGGLATVQGVNRPFGAALAVMYVTLFALYVFTLGIRYATADSIFGLDPYFEIGAMKRIQEGAFQFGSSNPYPAVSEFPLFQFFSIMVMEVTGSSIFQVANFIAVVLSLVSVVAFVVLMRQVSKDSKIVFVWSFALVLSGPLLMLNFRRELLSFPLLLLFIYCLVKRRQLTSLSLSIIIFVLAISLTLGHQIDSSVAVLFICVDIVVLVLMRKYSTDDTLRRRYRRAETNYVTAFAVTLVGYWFLVTISVPDLVARMNYILVNSQTIATRGFEIDPSIYYSYLLAIMVNGIIGLFVLSRYILDRETRSATIGLTLALTAGVLLILGLSAPVLGVGLDLYRFLFFIQVFIPLAYVVVTTPRSFWRSKRWATNEETKLRRKQQISILVTLAIIVPNLIFLPVFMVDSRVPPNYRAGEIRLYLSPTEIAALSWLPPNAVALGDHYSTMASIFTGHGYISENQEQILEANVTAGKYQWYIFDDGYNNRILDRCNLTYVTASSTTLENLDADPANLKLYDNGQIMLFTTEPKLLQQYPSKTFYC